LSGDTGLFLCFYDRAKTATSPRTLLPGMVETMTQPSYDPAQWQELFWQRGDRYYWCALRQNLFGEWVLLCKWGGRRTGKGGQRETLCADREEGYRLMQEVFKRRHRRGYVLIH
jgi:hypothetical protein